MVGVGSDAVTCWSLGPCRSRQPPASAAICRLRPPSASLRFLLRNNPSAVSHLNGCEAVCDLEQEDGRTSGRKRREAGEDEREDEHRPKQEQPQDTTTEPPSKLGQKASMSWSAIHYVLVRRLLVRRLLSNRLSVLVTRRLSSRLSQAMLSRRP